jgi:hypothetical protein
VDVADVIYLIDYLYKNGLAPDHLSAADANADCVVDIADVIYLINYLYKNGPEPVLGCAK